MIVKSGRKLTRTTPTIGGGSVASSTEKVSPTAVHCKLGQTLWLWTYRHAQVHGLGECFLELRCTFGGESLVPDLCYFAPARVPGDPDGAYLPKGMRQARRFGQAIGHGLDMRHAGLTPVLETPAYGRHVVGLRDQLGQDERVFHRQRRAFRPYRRRGMRRVTHQHHAIHAPAREAYFLDR